MEDNILHYQIVVNIIKQVNGIDKNIKGIEIGVKEGTMESTILESLPNCYMYGIDPSIDGAALKESMPDKNRVEFIVKTSDEACKMFSKKSMDFVYIDGLHAEDQCKKDFLNYYPLVKDDGWIGGHDYEGKVHGVKPFVDSFFNIGQENKLVHFEEDLVWWVKIADIPGCSKEKIHV